MNSYPITVSQGSAISTYQPDNIILQLDANIEFTNILGRIQTTSNWGPVRYRPGQEGNWVLGRGHVPANNFLEINVKGVSQIMFENLNVSSASGFISYDDTNYESEILKPGRMLRWLCVGDSLTNGTSSYAGIRGWVKKISTAWGYPSDFIGSLTSQQTSPIHNESGRDGQHEGVSGIKILQMAQRLEDYDEASYGTPDVILAGGFSNNFNDTSESVTMSHIERLIYAAQQVNPTAVIGIWGTTLNVGSGVPVMDGTQTPVINAFRRVLAKYPNVKACDVLTMLYDRYTLPFNVDSVHGNDVGYYRYAMSILKSMLGGPHTPIEPIPYKFTSLTSIAANTYYPAGAKIQCTGGTVNVVTLGGQTRAIVFGGSAGTAYAWPANTPLPFTVVGILSSGSTLGTNTLSIAEYPVGSMIE